MSTSAQSQDPLSEERARLQATVESTDQEYLYNCFRPWVTKAVLYKRRITGFPEALAEMEDRGICIPDILRTYVSPAPGGISRDPWRPKKPPRQVFRAIDPREAPVRPHLNASKQQKQEEFTSRTLSARLRRASDPQQETYSGTQQVSRGAYGSTNSTYMDTERSCTIKPANFFGSSPFPNNN